MRKKSLIILVVIGVLLSSTVGAKAVDLRLGAQAQFLPDLSELTDSSVSVGSLFTDFSNYSFGADARLKLFIAEIGLGATFGKYDATQTEISALATAGVALDLFNFMRIGVGAGPRFRVLVGGGGTQVIDDAGTAVPWTTFGDAFLKSPVAAKANVDFKIGKIVFGVSYTVDTEYTFEGYKEVKNLFKGDWKAGRFGAGVYYSFF